MDADLSEALWLVHNGVPFDVAFQIEPTMRAAMSIRFSIFAGGKFNFETMRFDET
jgi:hypothetical protein